MKWDKEMGTVTSVAACVREGRIGTAVTVEFYDGHYPGITLATVAQQSPVKIIECVVDDVKPHPYVADASQFMGDCQVCGHLQGAAIHKVP